MCAPGSRCCCHGGPDNTLAVGALVLFVAAAAIGAAARWLHTIERLLRDAELLLGLGTIAALILTGAFVAWRVRALTRPSAPTRQPVTVRAVVSRPARPLPPAAAHAIGGPPRVIPAVVVPLPRDGSRPLRAVKENRS